MGTMLIGSVFSSVARTLLSHGLVVNKHPQDALVRSLVHTSRSDRHRTGRPPFEPSAQLLYTTRRAIPPVAHCGLIDDASAFAATEKPDAAVCVPRIQDARGAGPLGVKSQVGTGLVGWRSSADPALLLSAFPANKECPFDFRSDVLYWASINRVFQSASPDIIRG